MPKSGWKIHRQISTEATMGVTDGRKYRVRNTFVPRMPWSSSTASSSDTARPIGHAEADVEQGVAHRLPEHRVLGERAGVVATPTKSTEPTKL